MPIKWFQQVCPSEICRPTEHQSLVVRNTIYNVAGYACKMLLAIFITPIIIQFIGAERFGIWVLMGLVSGYFGLFDFGLGTSLVKYLSEYYAKRENEKINRLINTGITFYLLFTLLLIIVTGASLNFLLAIFKIPLALRSDAVFALWMSVMLFGLSAAFNIFVSLQTAMQRMDVTNKISVLFAAIAAISTVVVLRMGYGFRGMIISNATLVFLNLLVSIRISRTLFPPLRFRPCLVDGEMARQLFRFGSAMQIAKISWWISCQVDKLIIGALLSLTLITQYELGSIIVGYAMGVSAILVSALLPAFAQIAAFQNRAQLSRTYLKALKWGVALLAPLFVFLGFSGEGIMRLWMGEGYASVGTIVTILALGFLVNAVAQIPASVCMAINKPGYLAAGSLLIIIVNPILSYLLIKGFGFVGAAWGTAIAVNMGTMYFIVMLHRKLSISGKRLFATVSPFVCVTLLVSVAVMFLDRVILQSIVPGGRFMFILQAGLFAILYVGVILKMRLLESTSRDS